MACLLAISSASVGTIAISYWGERCLCTDRYQWLPITSSSVASIHYQSSANTRWQLDKSSKFDFTFHGLWQFQMFTWSPTILACCKIFKVNWQVQNLLFLNRARRATSLLNSTAITTSAEMNNKFYSCTIRIVVTKITDCSNIL